MEEIEEKQKALGSLTTIEKRTAIWLVIAVVLWLTDSVHGINVGWVTLGIAMCMSLPLVGEVLTPKSWGQVPVHVLVFLTSAMAIGTVGGQTGMNAWIADTILPGKMPENMFILAIMIAAVAVVVHMFMGSVIAVMGVVIPSVLVAVEPLGVPAIAVALIVYAAIASHYILPFHHLNMLVGQGEENGMYTQKETIRLGAPLTVVVFIIVVVEVIWWNIIGLL